MKTIQLFLFVLPLLIYSSCSKPTNPEFKKMENVLIESINKGEVVIAADAVCHNPNKIGVLLQTMDMKVFVQDTEGAHVVQDVEAEMPPQADFSIPMKIKVPLNKIIKDKGLLGLAGTLLGKQEATLHFKGHAKVKAGGIPIKVPIDYEEVVTLKTR